MPLHDYVCLAHGNFDAMVKDVENLPPCPHGCSGAMVRRAFIKAPGLISARTTASDSALSSIADQHHLTNMDNQNGASSVLRTNGSQETQEASMRRQFMDTATKPSALGDNVVSSLGSMGFQGGNSLKELASSLTQPKAIPHASWDGK